MNNDEQLRALIEEANQDVVRLRWQFVTAVDQLVRAESKLLDLERQAGQLRSEALEQVIKNQDIARFKMLAGFGIKFVGSNDEQLG